MSENDRIASNGRVQGAMWFAASERLLSPEHAEGNYTDVPGYFCASLSFELLLKAAASKMRIDQRNLRSPGLRHSLMGLTALLEKIGFSISADTKRVLHALNAGHETHQVRYSILEDGQRFPVIPWEELRAAYNELILLTHPSRLPPIAPTNFSNR